VISTLSRGVVLGLGLACLLFAPLPPVSGALVATNLLCDFTANPLGVDEVSPHLSWQLQPDLSTQMPPDSAAFRDQSQTAYQILVASSLGALAADRGDLWDSRKVSSGSSVDIAYAGLPLASAQPVFWKLRVWDQSGRVSAWSSPATWTMGLLAASDWRGSWLCAETNAPLPIFRREFVVKPGLQRALIFICGLGQYELTANGQKIGNNLLAPGWSKYDKTCLYDTYEITANLRPGANALGVMLGNGMYNVEKSRRYTKFTGSFGPPTLIAQLHLFYSNGTSEVIATDPSWRAASGPMTFSSVFGGEDFDARLEPLRWNQPGFDDANWLPAVAAKGPGGNLKGLSCAAPPVQAFETFYPGLTNTIRPGLTVYDLGQNTSFMIRLEAIGPRGSSVRIVPAELLNPDGTVNRDSCGGGRAWWQYTLAGTGDENWSSRFFYHGCRYLQVECRAATTNGELPVVESLAGLVVHSASTPVGEFACSNDLFNRIHTLIRWAQRANIVSVLTDCPHRERLGWLEQYHLNGPSLRYEFDLTRLYTKGMNDMADSQLGDGLVPDIAPEYPVFRDGFRDSPEWGSSFVIVPWQQYQFTGDRELLRRYYDGMKRYVHYLGSKSNGGIVSHGLGDWYDIGPKPPGFSQLTPNSLTATAFYYYDTWILAQSAALLERSDDAKNFADQARSIRAVFNARFFNPTNHVYATGSQCANAIPLVMNICEPENRAVVLDAIVADIRRHGNAITAGDVGYRYLLRALAEGGRSDVIFDMNNQSDKPGYGYQLKMGATSLTEAWDGNRADSQDHFMLGQIMEWFYSDLAGIASDPDGPGFEKIIIHPQAVGDLTWVKAAYNSVHGRIACEWHKTDSTFSLHLSIPANTTATVYLPAANVKSVTESGQPAAKSLGVHFVRKGNGCAVYRVGSGEYQFVAASGDYQLMAE
jgi:hypothetical protein